MNRQAAAAAQARRHRLRWAAVAVAGAVLAAGFVAVAYQVFSARAVLLRSDQLEAALIESIRGLDRKETDTVVCPDRDLRRGDSVVCDVTFTDGTSARLRIRPTGRPGNVGTYVEGA